ncbi:MAG: hypothetical protein R3F37_12860 [Candidatus Competibacteraceae bacterium]
MRSNDSGIIGGVAAMTLVNNRFVDQSTKLFGDLRPHTLVAAIQSLGA